MTNVQLDLGRSIQDDMASSKVVDGNMCHMLDMGVRFVCPVVERRTDSCVVKRNTSKVKRDRETDRGATQHTPIPLLTLWISEGLTRA